MTDTPEQVQTTVLARQEQPTTALTPAEMLSIAVQQNADTAKLEKLMELQERYEANRARKAYAEAIVQFRAACPTIIRTGSANYGQGKTSYTYAKLPDAVEQIQKLMQECGLAVTWQTPEQTPTWVKVKCTITHCLGHSESTELGGPPDTSGSKNQLQAIKSTWTYLRRTTLWSLLGLVDKDEVDGDGDGGSETQKPKPKSSALTDPGEAASRLEFGKLVRQRANAPEMGNDTVRNVYSSIQKMSGMSSVADCLNWLRGNTNALIDARGNVTDTSATNMDFEDQSSAAAAGPTSPATSLEPDPQPPSMDGLRLRCDECGQAFKVKPASHKNDKGEKCFGVVVKVEA